MLHYFPQLVDNFCACHVVLGRYHKPFSLMNSGHCPELLFHTCSTHQEIVRDRCVLTYWTYSVWFRRGEAPGWRHDAKSTLSQVCNLVTNNQVSCHSLNLTMSVSAPNDDDDDDESGEAVKLWNRKPKERVEDVIKLCRVEGELHSQVIIRPLFTLHMVIWSIVIRKKSIIPALRLQLRIIFIFDH